MMGVEECVLANRIEFQVKEEFKWCGNSQLKLNSPFSIQGMQWILCQCEILPEVGWWDRTGDRHYWETRKDKHCWVTASANPAESRLSIKRQVSWVNSLHRLCGSSLWLTALQHLSWKPPEGGKWNLPSKPLCPLGCWVSECRLTELHEVIKGEHSALVLKILWSISFSFYCIYFPPFLLRTPVGIYGIFFTFMFSLTLKIGLAEENLVWSHSAYSMIIWGPENRFPSCKSSTLRTMLLQLPYFKYFFKN